MDKFKVGDNIVYKKSNGDILHGIVICIEKGYGYPYLCAFDTADRGMELLSMMCDPFMEDSVREKLVKTYGVKFVAFADSKELRLINTSKDIKKNSMKSEKSSQNWGKNKFHREKCSIKNNNAYPETYWIDKNNHDAVNHPSHYCRDGIECIDVIKATTKGMNAFDAFCQGNAMKYLFRWQYKNGVEDLKKARWYIDKLIEIQESSVNKKKE